MSFFLVGPLFMSMFGIALISSLLHVCVGLPFCDLHDIFSPSCLFSLFLSASFFWGLQGDEKYRCSETGYRIPFKCLEIKDSTKDAKKTKSQKGRLSLEISDGIAESHKVSHVAGEINPSQSHRRLVDDSSSSDNSSQAYITYRSCITPVNEEKLSVLNFEVILQLLVYSYSYSLSVASELGCLEKQNHMVCSLLFC